MREKTIEQALTKAVKSYGGIAVKLVSPGFVGMPDRTHQSSQVIRRNCRETRITGICRYA